jgi:hypothetical protein
MKSGRRRFMFWRQSGEDSNLVQECAAFLSGGYLSHYDREWGRVPLWAWFSTLAHGQRSDIEALAARGGAAYEIRTGSYLAYAVLAAIDSHALDLRSLQRDVLIPVELECDLAEPRLATRRVCATVMKELKRASAVADQRTDSKPGQDAGQI